MALFKQIFANDPNNPSIVATNGVISIFAPGTRTLIALKTVAGGPLSNPLQLNSLGFGPAFAADGYTQVAWEAVTPGQTFTGTFESYEGVLEQAVAAKVEAAEGAAAELAQRIAAGQFNGADGKDGANVATTRQAVADELEDPDSPGRAVLSATYGPAAQAASAPLKAAFAPAPTARLGNRMVNLGDSITIAGENVRGNTPQFNESYGNVAATLSQGKLSRVFNAGIGGNTAANMLARFDTDVTPYNPNIVTIMAGANDSNQGVALEQYAANIKALVAKCAAIRAVPVLITCTPVNYASGTSQETVMRSYNAWIRRYADLNNILVVDFFAIMSDPAQRFKNRVGFVNTDGIHPNTSGQRILGAELWKALSPRITAAAPWLTQDASDPNNIITNGLFLTDTAGLGTSWNNAGTPSAGTFARSIVTDTNVRGRMQRLTITGATGSNTIEQYYQASGGKFAIGDTIRFAGIITATGGARATAFINHGGGRYASWITDDAVTRAYFEIETVFQGTSTILQPQLSISDGTGSADFGQVTLYNVTRQNVISV